MRFETCGMELRSVVSRVAYAYACACRQRLACRNVFPSGSRCPLTVLALNAMVSLPPPPPPNPIRGLPYQRNACNGRPRRLQTSRSLAGSPPRQLQDPWLVREFGGGGDGDGWSWDGAGGFDDLGGWKEGRMVWFGGLGKGKGKGKKKGGAAGMGWVWEREGGGG